MFFRRRVLVLACFASLAVSWGDEQAAMAHARRSFELSKAGDLEQAEAEMRLAITAAPGNALFHSALGGILSRRGKLLDARESFAAAVKLDDKPAFRSQLALKQWETGDLEGARDNLLLLTERNPDQAETLEMLKAVSLDWGALLAKQGRWKAGLAVATDTAARFESSAPAWQMRGFFETKNQQNLSAVSSYERASALDPECVDCVVGLAVAQSSAGQPVEANSTFETALRKWPRHAVLHQAYGVHLLRASHDQPELRTQAIEHLQTALKLDPQLLEARYQLGNEALESGDIPNALNYLKEAAASKPPVPAKVFYALSRAWRRAGEAERAAEAMRQFEEQKRKEQP